MGRESIYSCVRKRERESLVIRRLGFCLNRRERLDYISKFRERNNERKIWGETREMLVRERGRERRFISSFGEKEIVLRK